MDNISASLISAAERGDAIALKTLLLSIPNPTTYLNQVYRISDHSACTLLMMCCLNNHAEMVRMLLDSFQLDLEVLNTVQISVNHQPAKVYENATVLWAATAAFNSCEIIKMLVEHGAQVNHRIKTNSTPFRCVCFHGDVIMARYLIEHGADPHIHKQYNDTNLILSVFRGLVPLVHYLVDELGCDVNESDDEKLYPLYLAVDSGSLELVQFLVSRGARNSPKTHNRLTPLMLAADKRRTDLMDAMASCCSVSEQIEAEELLGSTFACREYGMHNLQKALEHFAQALKLRLTHHQPKSLRESVDDIFQYRQECQTIEQLNELQSNPDHIHIEALLIRERLLGPAHPKYHLSLLHRGGTLVHAARFEQGMALYMYILKLQQQRGTLGHAKQLRYLVTTFAFIISRSSAASIKHFVQLINVIIQRLDLATEEFDFDLYSLLFLITIGRQALSQTPTAKDDCTTFYRLVYTINQKRYVTRKDGSSLLHLALSECSSSSNTTISRVCKYPCAQTVRTLLDCGADVNAGDAYGNTPLHVFVSTSHPLNEPLLQLLCTAGAHSDYVNNLCATPADLISDLKAKHRFQANAQSSLKCLCARVIQKSRLPVRDTVASALATFVQRH